jgi:hypothetical protein
VDRALALSATNADALSLRAIVAVASNQPDRAVAAANAAVAADARSAAARVARSYALQARFDLAGAREALDKAVELAPGDALAWARLAEVRSALGDRAGARAAALEVIGRAPADGRFAPLVERALALLPPGPVSAAHAPSFRRWLEWGNELFVRGRAALPPPSMQRLALGAGDLPSSEAALAALAGGDLVRAELIERRLEAVNTETWAPYWLAKGRVLAGRGEGVAAAAAFARTHRGWRGSVVETAARAAAGGGDARARLTALAATEWPATAWRWRGGVAWADFVLGAAAPGLVVAVASAPADGAALRVAIDGATVAAAAAAVNGMVAVSAPVEAGPHLVQVESIGGGRVSPGSVRLMRVGP